MRKKIVLVHNTTKYINMHYREFVEELLGRELDVVCVAPKDDSVAELENIGVACRDIKLTRKGINPITEIQVLRELCSILGREKPDIVFNYSIKPVIYGSLAARAAGVKYIFSMITGFGYVFMRETFKQRFLERLVSLIYRWALGYNQKVFFQNPDDRDFFVQQSLIDTGKTVVINGTGIDIEQYVPADKRPTPTRFLMVARLLKDKGVHEYVEAARQLKKVCKDAQFQLLGPIDENPAAITREEVAQWERDGLVVYMGETADVRPYLRQATVFVLPSYREGLPRATLEALAMGMPVVTSDVAGCRETVCDKENGFLVQPKDARALAQAMRRFIENPDLVTDMGQRSRMLAVQHFDVHKVNETIINNINQSISI